MPRDESIRKVLVIGSGPICRVLKESGVQVVLCNTTPATIMTDQSMADAIYLAWAATFANTTAPLPIPAKATW